MADELARVRRKFVDKVSKVLIKQLLDDLLDDGVLNDGQKDSIVEEYSTTADKARVLIDTVKKKGDEASRKLIAHIHSRDSTLYSELGLSCVQPAQPAAVRLSEQEWSITLNPATESFWMDKVKDNNVYPVDKKSIKNRVALLITNIKFTDEKLNRNGADKDEENMEKLLTALKYEVVKYTNLTGKAIDDAILKFSKHPKLKETDSVIVVIMSHGKLGKVLGVDWKKGDEKPDEFLIDNIYKHLGSEKCPALLDKPKIIIIQACRGEEEGSAFVRDVVSDDASQSNLPPPADEDNLEADTVKCVHKEKDFTALLSCTPDTVSYRQRDLGSFLIQYIVEVFNTFAHKDDIEELFRRVMQRFEKFSPRTKRQMPTKDRCTLIKRFYFFPLDNKPPLSVPSTLPLLYVPSTQPPLSVPSTLPLLSVPSTLPLLSVPSTQPPLSVPSTQPPLSVPSTQPPLSVPSTQPPLSVPSTQPPLNLFSYTTEIQILEDGPLTPSSAQDLDIIVDEQEEPVSQSLSHVSQHQLGEPVDETDLQNIQKKLVSKVDESFCPTSNQINVCRNNVLLCSLRAFKRRNFNPEAKLNVVFVDEDGNGEGAVDEGGPTREYLRLLMRAIHQSNIFEGHEKDRQLSLDTQALQTNLYTWVAKMIAVCVVHGGVGPHFFSERLFQQICGIPTSLANVDEVCDHTFRQQLIKIQEATTVQEANSAIAEAADSLSIIGALRHVSNLKEKDSLVQSAADFFVDGRMQTALDQFVEGFRTLGLLEELRENPAVFRSMFVSEERPLQAKDLFSLFGVDYSVQGSNKRAKENSTICYWRDWLIDIEEGECSPITLEKVLEFTSGASTVPPLGFPHRPQIHFIHEANRVFPEANTCLIILRLPIHSDYEDFRKYMEEGILQAPTFGVA
ncbi:uncharacterized protein LOC126398392 isoform X1 [Epinephelus moara]|uniref:uncharacterized protein LOC126398392 isoform X1 n=1 Tax=Epinephelus moara TaxID=300413 RepID=UPI00214F1771|nr:uncharacterized protein LOC126398392 isoform X1 [Epinephelus moara]